VPETLEDLRNAVVAFRDERNWGQFHSLRQLSTALSVEAGEVQQLTLWKTDDEVRELLENDTFKRRLSDEVADVIICALMVAAKAGIEPSVAVREKLNSNAAKYPVDLVRGKNAKYTEYPLRHGEGGSV